MLYEQFLEKQARFPACQRFCTILETFGWQVTVRKLLSPWNTHNGGRYFSTILASVFPNSEDGQKSLLRDVHAAYSFHALLAFFLLFQ